ncbi:hypothetical protein BH10BAC4_BH10BAC4_11060 [soil metagenome]
MKFNEDSRVKIPTILHLIRLGYGYLSLAGQTWDESNNIFKDIFYKSIGKINPALSEADIKRFYDEIALCLENEDLGKSFYEKLVDQSGTRLLDFDNFDNNSFHVVSELTCKKDEEEFRPDITLLINGMPLVFIEVKKPNNQDGILAELNRIQKRFQNKKFRNFVNITQLMIFSNNMPYQEGSLQKLEGAFYATTSYGKPLLNYFREEEKFNLSEILKEEEEETENFVLVDTNYVSIKNSQEFLVNKNSESPTNTMCTSLLKRDRLAFVLKYAIVYVKETSGLQKHIMRYPQIFATKAIGNKLDEGIRKGIIWHTQGSGKTALAFYNVKFLTDYFQKKGVIPKFYFIVDRLDLLIQAGKEFRSRGLVVHEVNSREEFARDIKTETHAHPYHESFDSLYKFRVSLKALLGDSVDEIFIDNLNLKPADITLNDLNLVARYNKILPEVEELVDFFNKHKHYLGTKDEAVFIDALFKLKHVPKESKAILKTQRGKMCRDILKHIDINKVLKLG